MSPGPTPTDGEVEAAAVELEKLMADAWFREPCDPPHPDAYTYATSALQTAANCPDGTVARLTRERDEARGHIKMWAADCCDDPADHSQRHSGHGVAQGNCARCGMSWPCPTNLVATEFPFLLDIADALAQEDTP